MTADELQALYEQTTPGPWHWNSYSALCAKVPKGHPLDMADPDEPGIALILTIAQAPEFAGHGDELHHPQTRANARFVEAVVSQWPFLYREFNEAADTLAAAQEEARRLREELAEIKRPLDAEMARLNENLIAANAERDAIRRRLKQAEELLRDFLVACEKDYVAGQRSDHIADWVRRKNAFLNVH